MSGVKQPAICPAEEAFDLEEYLARSAERIVKQLVKSAAFHPKASLFMAKYALASKKAAQRRKEAAARGEHIPPFLIASITSACNLHCVGCYARSLETCGDECRSDQLSGEDWGRVFSQARDLGISFILLAGGEPMLRRDVLEQAAQYPEILFPVITNGTLLSGEYLDFFETNRNLIPVLSIEGNQGTTDARRGEGMFRLLCAAMGQLSERGLTFGTSITVTAENLTEVTSDSFLGSLTQAGCKAVIYVEFVPTEPALQPLALDEAGRLALEHRVAELRKREDTPMLVSFPGDEKGSKGCLAAGRGFFHINARGGAEPCPFSPYSDVNVKDHSLREVLDSALVRALREEGLLEGEHDGGCVLYQKQAQVEALLQH